MAKPSKIKSIAWLGSPVHDPEVMGAFYRDYFDLSPVYQGDNYQMYRIGDGALIELFSDKTAYPFMTHPIAGFQVEDIDAQRSQMEEGGIEFFGPIHTTQDNSSKYSHFRAPDGFVYELTQKLD